MMSLMTEHRVSYRRTAGFALSIAFVCSVALFLLVRNAAIEGGLPTGILLLPAAVGGLVLLGALAGGLLASIGGFICLRRDSLEARGLPYASRRPQQRKVGPFTRAILSAFRFLRPTSGRRPDRLDLRPGELVEVRSLDQILAVLDEHGEADSLPFMPEMAAWTGRQARVLRRVDKWYDWIRNTGLRRMRRTVFLEGCRCDGSGHDGCQAGCQMFWKEAWLKRVGREEKPHQAKAPAPDPQADLRMRTRAPEAPDIGPRYICQMTRLPEATEPLSWHDPRHYLRDLWTGNVRFRAFLTGRSISFFNFVQKRTGGPSYPMRNQGPGGAGRSSHPELDLRPGEVVRIRTKREIEASFDGRYRNRGLWFDPDMLRYCGGTYRVLRKVTRQIDEKSGRMLTISNPCIVLDGVTATGEYIAFALLNELTYWRESWLERINAPSSSL
jgi:hypothetical protein